ncbi:hypothetical protein [Streptomyces sp. CC219B]|uniref:hypothetical protein n=1 Tax=Streptomyces sp. CC219B TaxID=3044574 RepID=UPI0024A90BAD|nr:hypothetical protein [Streptomyces sp. CC219B]
MPLPGERLDPAQALTAYAAGSTRLNHLDDTGRARPGAPTDLVVLDRDPFGAPLESSGDTPSGPDLYGERASIRSSRHLSSNGDHGRVTV